MLLLKFLSVVRGITNKSVKSVECILGKLMTYTSSKFLTFEEFLHQYGDNSRYELADGELIDMEPTDPLTICRPNKMI